MLKKLQESQELSARHEDEDEIYILISVYHNITEFLHPSCSHCLDRTLPSVCSVQPPVTHHKDPWRLEVKCCKQMTAKEVRGTIGEENCENY